jgi:RNA polymerase sigma-70 factor, ECF subfamily
MRPGSQPRAGDTTTLMHLGMDPSRAAGRLVGGGLEAAVIPAPTKSSSLRYLFGAQESPVRPKYPGNGKLASPEHGEPPGDEHKLVELAQRGDRQAFAVLVERYWNSLYRWLYHLSHDRHTAEDLAQDSILKAFGRLSTFEAGSNFRAWLFRIAYNGFVSMRRTERSVRQRIPSPMAELQPGPAERLISQELVQAVARAVGRLPTEFRAAFLLRVEHGLPFREIGAVLRIKEETARWRLFKARQKLMDILGKELDKEDE